MIGEVDHVCEHRAVHEITGKPPRTCAYIFKKLAEQPCPDCKTRVWQEGVQVDNATSAALTEEREWPTITGSEKQVAWANTLRVQLLDRLSPALAELIREGQQRGWTLPAGAEAVAVIREVALTHTDARWWIEHRKRLPDRIRADHPRRLRHGCGEAGLTAVALLMWISRHPQ